MRQRLTPRDVALLLATLPLFLVVLALHVQESARTALAQLPVYAVWQPGDYPTVGGYRLETDSSGSGLRPGDRLVAIGDRDLRGVGHIGFQAIGLARTVPGEPVPLVFERDGERRTVALEARPHPQRWARIPLLVLIPVFCVVLLLGAPGQAGVQRLYVAFMTLSIGYAHFYGGPEWKTWAAGILWNLAAPLMVFFMLRWARLFPGEMRDADRVPAAVPWVVALTFAVVVRGGYVFGWPLPPAWVPPVSFSMHALIYLLGIAILTRNYLRAEPVGRRRLRWILLFGALGALPVIAAGLMPVLVPGWEGFRQAYALGYLSSVIWVLGAVLAVVRDNAFDVDRLIIATTAWALALGAGFAGFALAAPLAAGALSDVLGLDPTTTRLVLAALLGALVLPVGSRLRPRIGRLLFPARIAIQEGAETLADTLADQEEPGALLERSTRGVHELFEAVWAVLLTRAGDEADARRVLGAAPLAPGAAVDPSSLPVRLRPGNAPRWPGAADSIVVPIARGAAPDAWIWLGPKRSGDIYTSGDAAVLTALAARVETAWVRFEKRIADREVREKTNLLAAASHDLRQPLHAVALLTEALQRKLDDPQVRALVERIGSSTQDLDEMLGSLLDRSRLDAGAVRPDVGAVPLAEIFARLERDFGPQAEARGLRLRVVPTRLGVRSDRLLLARILRNLVSNAVRYTDEGTVCVAARRRGSRVAIEVRDSGPGISSEDQREIFEAFRQLAGGDASGLGLGLSIVDGLASVLGHEVTVRSAPGRGSNFCVWAPRVERAPAGEGRAGEAGLRHAPPSAAQPGVGALSVRRVLVVDDDPRVRDASRALLEGWGCEVREVADGRAALAVVADWTPDFAIVDHDLGAQESGTAVVAALRKAVDPQLPTAIVTGESEPARLQAIRDQGLRVLRKPVRPARLRALLSAREAPSQDR